jgi:hypothetical protein
VSGVESASVRISRPPGCVQPATGREYVICSPIVQRTPRFNSRASGHRSLRDTGRRLATRQEDPRPWPSPPAVPSTDP